MIFKCPFCKKTYVAKEGLYNHMEKQHLDDLCGLPACQVFFNFRNRYELTRGNGKSIISGLPTKFNPVTERYEKFANDNERQQYREIFKQRMMKIYGKTTLLDDPEQQKKLLANRSISGQFKWPNGQVTTYTGSFERKFLEHLVNRYDWINPDDLFGPCPVLISYEFNGANKVHIPDFLIGSLNLIVNIKSKENHGYRLREIDREHAEDNAIKETSYNYIKIYDNDFSEFDKLMDIIKDTVIDNNKRIFII